MIAFVDDEEEMIEQYLLALKGEMSVKFFSTYDKLMEFIAQPRRKMIHLVILDITMYNDKTFPDRETNGGRKTGLRFLEWMRDQKYDVEAIVLTNLALPAVEEAVKALGGSVILKPYTLPMEFLDSIREKYRKAQVDGRGI